MKKNFKKGAVLFLAGMLVMQLVFNEGTASNAAHSETGTIKNLPNMRVIMEADSNRVSPAYCIDRNLYCQTNDVVTSNKTLDEQKSLLLNAAFVMGFNCDTTISEITQVTSEFSYDDTQNVIWAIMENKFDGSIASAQNLNGCNKTLATRIAYMATAPSYVNDTENVMKWNTTTSKFELTLTNTTVEGEFSASKYLQVDTSSLPNGVTAKVEGENLVLESTEEFTDVKAIKLYKRAADKGLVIAWDNGNGTKQPQITLDYGEAPIAKVVEVKVKTENKPVVATPEPTVQPTEQPEVQAPVIENQKVEVKENTLAEESSKDLDNVPKTADSSNLSLVYKLMGASIFTMLGFVVIEVIKRKKYNA